MHELRWLSVLGSVAQSGMVAMFMHALMMAEPTSLIYAGSGL